MAATVTRSFSFRASLRTIYRRPALPRLSGASGRRGYVSMQDRIAKSSDMPLAIAAASTTALGLAWLSYNRRPGKAHNGQESKKQEDPSENKGRSPSMMNTQSEQSLDGDMAAAAVENETPAEEGIQEDQPQNRDKQEEHNIETPPEQSPQEEEKPVGPRGDEDGSSTKASSEESSDTSDTGQNTPSSSASG